MASLLAPSAVNQPAARISQVLPTVKCLNCNQPVPLTELGDHICAKPPPVPAVQRPSQPQFPNPARLLPARMASPGVPPAGPPPQRLGTPPLRLSQSPHPPPQRVGSPLAERPRINTGVGPSTYPQRSSPLAQQAQPPRLDTSSFAQRPRDFAPRATSPLRPMPPSTPRPMDNRAHSASGASTRAPVPPSSNSGMYSAVQNPVPTDSSPLPPPPRMPAAGNGQRISFVPESEIGIDTRTGGGAGMAGVGRRGFAAAVRAARFVAPQGYHLDRRPTPPRFLDIDAASRSTDTPPLSAGSGYSSHSPSPLSPVPQAELIPEPLPRQLPSPIQFFTTPHQLPSSVKSPADEFNNGTNLSPLDRFGKFQDSISTSPEPIPAFEDVKHHGQSPPRPSKESARDSVGSAYSDDGFPVFRNLSFSSTTSRSARHDTNHPPPPDNGSDNDSDCGLAYANSDADEGDNDDDVPVIQPDTSLSSSILRSNSAAAASTTSPDINSRVRFSASPENKTSRPRNNSVSSSYSSASSSSKSSAIASALGFPPTSPSKRDNTTGLQRSTSASSTDSRSTYARVTSMGPTSGPIGRGLLEQRMETLLEEVVLEEPSEQDPTLDATAEDPPSVEEQSKHTKGGSQDKGIGFLTLSSGTQPQRSNTVQVPPHSPENKPPKLPARAKTTAAGHEKSALEPLVPRKKTRTRACLRCEKKIEGGRYVRVDAGGVLCERCWKNLYLPKCRRCLLPIEKQAVSSADGQLKGKYHKECFNCHVCQKSFPDKTFYVYDGQPHCAYHYHEANESLCAAARCGQPIEGPCAVSHNGDKYHPEHMTCEYPGNTPCDERLKEYWEVDGRMLCERHAAKAGGDDNEEDEWVQTSKAKKRVTRFMNLGQGGLGDLL